ncbi:MAG: 4-amino-4-deoxychorismate lyase [Caulobacterales bacterium 32-69-10]|nr:MAG: 4-amino-4-deoxychorismate lyase [Caulobacterales bacterium 32-69-10]
MISADDRGFTLGDGLFETVLCDTGQLKLWDEHMVRMNRACEALGLPLPDLGSRRKAALGAIRAGVLGGERAAVRLSWSAGPGGRGLERPDVLAPQLSATAAVSVKWVGPARLATVSVRRNDTSPASRLKSLSYLDNILARREARAAGADEALMLNTRGELACAGASNLFWIEKGALYTPALECGVLDGIMRGVLIERAARAGADIREVAARPEALATASAVFLTNSLIGVRPVASLDGRLVGSDPFVQMLQALVADVS